MRYVLELDEEQAKVLSTACEFYSRVRMGQFNEIPLVCMQFKQGDDMNAYCDRRDAAEIILMCARRFIYPELNVHGGSYGVGKFRDADRAFDIYQVVRHALGDEREPWSMYDLPVIRKA